MSRINTNVPALIAARNLANNQASLNTALQRLSTGLRINSGKDDPAGLIASENLKTEGTAINAAIDNASRADNMVSVAEGALGEVNNLLTQVEDLTDRSANQAGLSPDEVKANQLQIDSILDSINRVANTTSFQGKKLLNGSFDYTTTGIPASALATVNVNSAKLPESGSRNVVVQLTASAKFGQLKFGTSQVGASATTIKVAGNYGSEMFSFQNSATVSAMAYAVNQVKEMTGVSATVSGTGAMYFNSIDYGSKAYVSVNQVAGGAFTTKDSTGAVASSNYGVDASVTINGTTAITDGLQASVRTSSLSVDLTMSGGVRRRHGRQGRQVLLDHGRRGDVLAGPGGLPGRPGVSRPGVGDDGRPGRRRQQAADAGQRPGERARAPRTSLPRSGSSAVPWRKSRASAADWVRSRRKPCRARSTP